MSEQLLIQKSTLVDIADAVRVKTGKAEEIAVVDLAAEIKENINVGMELPELTNPGESTDLLSGKELINGNGNVVRGTMPNHNAVSKTLDTLVTSYTIPEGYHDGSGKVFITTETKFITPTNEPQLVAPTDNKVLGAVIVDPVPKKYKDVSEVTATASDVLSGKKIVNSSGSVITGTIAFQYAKTITPSTTSQIAVSSGYYTSGTVTVAGDSNLKAENIKSGVSIFGVFGTAEVGGSIDDVSKSIITKTITKISDNEIKTIGSYMFYGCSSLTTASFPACTSIGSSAFQRCSRLTTISFPTCINIGGYAFSGCSNLTAINFPSCTSIGTNAFFSCSNLTTASFPTCINIDNYAFYRCSNLTTISFPACKDIGASAFASCSRLITINFPACSLIDVNAFSGCSNLTTASFPACKIITTSAFQKCSKLTTFILTGSSVPTLSNSNAFSSTCMSTTGYFYVPSSMISKYQAWTNWTYYSSRFSAVENFEGWDGIYGGIEG